MKSLKRTRLAPTPSGYLHWGNAYSFVLTWLIAKEQGAKILLRIDDLDAARKRPEYVEDIFRSLEWMGLTYDEGPTGPDDFEANYSQRHRIDLYRAGLETLRNSGALFACACSRADILRAPERLHPANCQAASLLLDQKGVAWRVRTAPQLVSWTDLNGEARTVELHRVMRDFVVRRSDLLPAYQLASIVDDSHYCIDLVVRGLDLIPSTAAQLWLCQWLDNSNFQESNFLHHAIVSDTLGAKLSKSVGAASLAAMRQESTSPASLFQRITPLLGLPEPVDSLDQALAIWLETN